MFSLILRAFRRQRSATHLSDLLRARRNLRALGLYLLAIGVLHIVAMMAFEGLSLGEAAWLTATTATTVGYGDTAASTAAGRWSTVVLIYLGGIFALGKGAGDYFDYRASRRMLKERGRWRWNLRDHVLFINAPSTGADTYFETLLRQFRMTGWGEGRKVLILARSWPMGLPASLEELDVVHVDGGAETTGRLDAADARTAAAVVILAAEESNPISDAVTFDTASRLVEMGVEAPIVAECVDDLNRERLRRAGATTVIRPMRGYPEMTVRALVAPGSESIIENLFTRHGDECLRYETPISGISWGKLATALLLGGSGTAIGYTRATDGGIVTNPLPGDPVNASALYVIVKEGHEPSSEAIGRLIVDAKAGKAPP